MSVEQEPAVEKKARVVGEVVMRPLKNVKKNPWNPNVMTPAQAESLKHGLLEDGWLASQALLVWGTDETGAKRDMVIDGEHRHTAATELGLKSGPMVFLNGLTEAEAKKLTVKMNQKRGQWDPTKLEDLLRGLDQGGEALSAIDLGFGEEELMKMLAVAPMEVPSVGDGELAGTAEPDGGDAPAPGTASGQPASPLPASQTRMVQLFLDSITQPQFLADCQKLGAIFGTTTVTDTVLEAVRRAAAGLDAPAV
jgi:ParB-like chromosome segregation protein Spo0J